MDDAERERMNGLIDVLFDQIQALSDDDAKVKAIAAVALWKQAKTNDFIGGVKMQTSHLYREAYDTLRGLGLEVGGMLPPVTLG